MKLYFSPGACSLSPHIALHEAGIAFEPVLASTKSHTLEDGTDYYTINPLGYVPLLELDDGTQLREGPVIVQYIADQAPLKNLAPANGTMQRYRLQEWLNFIGTEIHKGFSPMFNPATPEEMKSAARSKLADRYAWIDAQLAGKDHLLGEHFSVADGYLFTVTNWAKPTGLDLSAYPNVQAWHARVGERPGVKAALAAEAAAKAAAAQK
jgi:glutathione S-transferase